MFSRKPDFIGNYWLEDDVEQQKVRAVSGGWSREDYVAASKIGVGIFFMFIENRQKEGGLEKITGTIIDNEASRKSTFEGELSNDHIKFIKHYSEEAVRMHHVVDEIPYQGTKTKDGIFKGTYHMKKWRNNRIDWDGQFTLAEPFDPSMN